ncbi:MAG: ABC transporter ATP-binding protein [Pseudomonadota bacterium]
MTALTLSRVNKSFGDVHVLKDINLTVEDGEFVVFVGPSGCGKSTLLRVIAGLEDATSGTVEIAGEQVNDTPPAKRGIAMVFQSYALYPHLTVAGNMALGLKQEGQPKSEIDARITEASRMLSLADYLDRRPAELSGGQRQRVAIGRAIVREPKLFLFDEPLSNLDAALRMNTRVEIARLHRALDASMIYVTHDQTEAMTLADKIVVLREGRVEQVGSPMELYNDPANRFVAGFLGAPSMNFLPATLLGGMVGQEIGIRPEHIQIADDGPLSGVVSYVEKLGGDTNVLVELKDGQMVTVRKFGQYDIAPDVAVRLIFDEADAFLFDGQGARIVEAQTQPA